jgi:hypothetical protein
MRLNNVAVNALDCNVAALTSSPNLHANFKKAIPHCRIAPCSRHIRNFFAAAGWQGKGVWK